VSKIIVPKQTAVQAISCALLHVSCYLDADEAVSWLTLSLVLLSQVSQVAAAWCAAGEKPVHLLRASPDLLGYRYHEQVTAARCAQRPAHLLSSWRRSAVQLVGKGCVRCMITHKSSKHKHQQLPACSPAQRRHRSAVQLVGEGRVGCMKGHSQDAAVALVEDDGSNDIVRPSVQVAQAPCA
jgi:hypothetical protein